jgi:predicted metalloprotease
MGPIAIGGGIGLPAILVLVVALLVNGELGGESGAGIDSPLDGLRVDDSQEAPLEGPDPDKRLVEFMSFVLDDVQGFWTDTMSHSGRDYRRAKLVLFEGSTGSACGGASEQIGPHYCPADENVYLDLDFFRELRNRFDAPGDFAQAYVLAHEIAHHVQNVMGISGQVDSQQRADPNAANDLSVRLELQADCLAGVWAFTVYERELLESGDLEEGLNAAAAVGDDRSSRRPPAGSTGRRGRTVLRNNG